MEEKLHYIILSTGCYSDYSPVYYSGTKILSQETLNGFAKEACTHTYKTIDTLISKPHSHNNCSWPSFCRKVDHFYKNGKEAYIPTILEEEFWKKTRELVEAYGYEAIEPETAEINVEYSDLPFSREDCGLTQ